MLYIFGCVYIGTFLGRQRVNNFTYTFSRKPIFSFSTSLTVKLIFINCFLFVWKVLFVKTIFFLSLYKNIIKTMFTWIFHSSIYRCWWIMNRHSVWLSLITAYKHKKKKKKIHYFIFGCQQNNFSIFIYFKERSMINKVILYSVFIKFFLLLKNPLLFENYFLLTYSSFWQ